MPLTASAVLIASPSATAIATGSGRRCRRGRFRIRAGWGSLGDPISTWLRVDPRAGGEAAHGRHPRSRHPRGLDPRAVGKPRAVHGLSGTSKSQVDRARREIAGKVQAFLAARSRVMPRARRGRPRPHYLARLSSQWVDPRAGGEAWGSTASPSEAEPFWTGRSPRRRGKPSSRMPTTGSRRPSPRVDPRAWRGSRVHVMTDMPWRMPARATGVDPRAGGGCRSRPHTVAPLAEGRSPRRRGSLADGQMSIAARVDPRACGEASPGTTARDAAGGSIPAQAGKPAQVERRCRGAPGRSPRMRGSHYAAHRGVLTRGGSIPAQAGSRSDAGTYRFVERGSIPAQAGSRAA